MKKAYFANSWTLVWIAGLILVFLAANAASAETIKVNTTELQQLIEEGVPVIDVRTPEEWRYTGVIPDSHLITFFDSRGNYDLNGWLAKLFEVVTPRKPVVIICEVGNRSHMISNFLSAGVGFERVFDATGGISAWNAHSMPIRRWP